MKEYDKMKEILEKADRGVDYGNDRHKMSEEEILKDAIELFEDCSGEIKRLLLPSGFYLGSTNNQIDLEVETEFETEDGDAEEPWFDVEVLFNVLIEDVETDSGVEKADYDFDEDDEEKELTYYHICIRSYISTDLPKYINMLIENIKNNKFEIERRYHKHIEIKKQYLEQIKNNIIDELEDTLHSLKHYARVL